MTFQGGFDAILAGDALSERAAKVVATAVAYTAKAHEVVLATATAAFAVTLPAAAANISVLVKKVDASANVVTITPASGTIDGAATATLTAQWQSKELISDGTNWFLV